MSAAPAAGGRRAAASARLARDRWPLLALGAVFCLAAVVVWSKSRGWIFHGDEWAFVVDRRGHGVDEFLAPHNDHLSLAPVVIYKTLLELFGMTHYGAFMAVIIALNLTCGALVFALARTRVGDLAAVALAAVVVTLGPAWEDLLWPFQIGFLGSIAAGLGMLLALEAGTRRGDIAAAVLLGVAISFSGVGVPLIVVAAVYILVSPGARRTRLLRVVAVPLVLYAAWYLAYRDDVATYRDAIDHQLFAIETIEDAPRFALGMAGRALAALVGLDGSYGPPLIAVLVIALFVRLARPEALPARFWAVLTLVVVYLGLTALGRVGTQSPETSRYIYPAAVVLALLAVELAAGWRARGRAAAIVALVALLAVLGNLGEMRRAGEFEASSELLAPRLTMLELAADRVAPDYRPDPVEAPQLRADAYLAAVADWGSPADSVEEVARRSEAARQGADSVSVAALGPRVAPARPSAAPAPAPPVESTESGTAAARGRCQAFTPLSGTEGVLILTIPPAGLAVVPGAGPVQARVRRFADGYRGEADATLRPGEPVRLTMDRDRTDRPWHVRLSSSDAFRVCAAG